MSIVNNFSLYFFTAIVILCWTSLGINGVSIDVLIIIIVMRSYESVWMLVIDYSTAKLNFNRSYKIGTPNRGYDIRTVILVIPLFGIHIEVKLFLVSSIIAA